MLPCRVALVEFYADGHHAPYCHDLAIGLEEMGVQVMVLGPSILRETIGNDRFISLNGCERLDNLKGMCRQWASLHMSREAIAKAMVWHPTHIHFLYADWHVSAIAAAWRLSLPAAKLVLTIHWNTSVGAEDGLGVRNRLRRYPHQVALRWLADQVDARILVHHETIARKLAGIVDLNQIGVVPYPTKTLPIVGVEIQVEFRNAICVDKYDKLILCFGGTRFDKGADLAIRALAGLPDQFHLLIAGIAQHFQPHALRKLAAALGVEDRLHLNTGFLSDEEVALVFHACDIILLPYRRQFSGQSGPLIQAAAIGKPVVVADCTVLAETVQAFHLGIIFPSEDTSAMVDAVQAVAQWHPASEDTNAFVSYHSPQSFVRATHRNYQLINH